MYSANQQSHQSIQVSYKKRTKQNCVCVRKYACRVPLFAIASTRDLTQTKASVGEQTNPSKGWEASGNKTENSIYATKSMNFLCQLKAARLKDILLCSFIFLTFWKRQRTWDRRVVVSAEGRL
jgi:hypothetical protein